MRHHLTRMLLVSFALVSAGTTGAMGESPILARCTEGDTIKKCWDRWADPEGTFQLVDLDAPADATSSEREAIGNTTLGDFLLTKLAPVDGQDSAVSPGLKDFLNVFAATVENAEVNEGENSLNLTWNFPLLSFDKGKNAQVQVSVNEAAVYSPLEMAIPEDQRTDRVASLKQQLDDSSDVTIAFSYTALTEKLGRSFVPHADLYQPLFAKIVSTKVSDDDNARLLRFAKVLQDLGEFHGSLTEATPLAEAAQALMAAADPPEHLASLKGSSQEETTRRLAAYVEKVAGEEAALSERVRKALKGHPIRAFSNLLNNQPQLTFTARYRDREEAVGPSQTALTVTYEKGLFNLNSLNRYLRQQGELAGCRDMAKGDRGKSEACLNAVAAYGKRVLPYLDDANRFTFTASYNETDAYNVFLPASDDPVYSAVSVNQKKVEKLIASLAYGRVLTNDGQGHPVSRFDLEAKYEDIMDRETLIDDRLIVTAIYTRELSDQFSLPLSLVWANKDEFLPDVDEKISANFGLRFRVKGKGMPMTPPGDDSGS